MATRRTTIEIEVLNLADLQSANQALNTHIRIIQRLTAAYSGLNGVTGQFANGITTVNNVFNNFNNTTNNVNNNITNLRNNLNNANGAGQNFLVTMLRYRAVGLVFEGVTKAISGAVQAMNDLQTQEARIARVTGSSGKSLARAAIQEQGVRTGNTDVASLGEGYYQLSISVKDTAQRLDAYKTVMSLVTAEEADARDTARSLVSIQAQFREELNRTVPAAQQFGRVGEMVALLWKNGNLELNEYIQTAKYLNPVLKGVGADLAQSFAIAQAFSELGARGRQIGTGFGGLIQNIWGKTSDINEKLKDKGFKPIEVFKNDQGGFDVVKTFDKIIQTMSKLPPQARAAYAEIVGGSRAAVRSLEMLDTEATTKMVHSLDEFKKAQAGKTAELDRQLKERTDTFMGAFQKTWNSIIQNIGAGLDDISRNSGLLRTIQMLGSLNEEWARTRTQGAVRDANDRATLSRPDRAAQLLTASTLRQAIGSMSQGEGARMMQSPMAIWGRGSEGAIPSWLTEGMSAGQREMLSRRYFQGQPTTTADLVANMKRDLDILNRQLAAPGFGHVPPIAGLAPANPFTGGNTVEPVDQDALDKAAEEAARKRQAALDLAAKMAQQYLENAKKEFSETSPLVLPFIKRADEAARAAMADQPDQLYALSHGLAGNRPIYDKAREKSAQDAADKADKDYELGVSAGERRMQANIASAKSDYEISLAKNGVFSSETAAAAKRASTLEFAGANPDDLKRLQAGITGIGQDNRDKIKEATDAFAEAINAATEKVKSEKQFMEEVQAGFAQRTIDSGEVGIRALQRGARPNAFGDANAREQTVLQGTIDSLQQTLSTLKAIDNPTAETTKQIEAMGERLLDANTALLDFKDRLAQEAYAQRVKREQDAYSLQVEEIDHLHRLKFNKDESASNKDKIVEYQQLIVAAQKHVDAIAQENAGITGPKADDENRKAQKSLTEAYQNLSDFRIDQKIQKYQQVHSEVAGGVNGALLNFLHGKGSITDVLSSAGGSIVDASLNAQIKKFSDPLIQTVTGQILAIQNNTDALGVLNSNMNGSGPGGVGSGGSFSAGGVALTGFGAVVAAGVAVGAAASAAGGFGAPINSPEDTHDSSSTASTGPLAKAAKAKTAAGQSDLQKGIGAGLAAYSIASTSAQQGVNAGNFLGGVVSGAGIGATFGGAGALIGGAVGGIVDLIGGLFHHNMTPTATPQDLNPALYNAPAGMDLAAYNYSAYGKLPTLQDVGFNVKAANTPIIQVFVDGAATAAKQVVNSMGSSVAVNLINSSMDRFAPL